MIPRSLLTSAVLVLLLACSGDDGPAPSPQPELEPDPVARLPATLVGPEGDTVDVAGDSAVVVYLWLPLAGHRPTERDLRALARMAQSGRARVLPIQLSSGSRNAAQTQVNGLGLSMAVYLADSCILQSMDARHLPSVLLVRPGGQRAARGFGAASRLLLGEGERQ
ncbi:MAG: hypothetical protein ACQETZ_09220 [Candidatus Fermentibacterota bacterium]